METKHTPGPWKVFRTNAGELDSITTMNGLRVAGTVTFYGNNQGEANARLIAAAPELLEAAVACVNHVRGYHDTLSDGELEVLNLCQAAIAKATGEQA